MAVAGLHHVTAISSSGQATLDFHVRVLGLRLVKRTVNFEDSRAWHLYFGDASGAPGTLITFFARPGTRPGGRGGAGMATSWALAVPRDSLDGWKRRLKRLGVPVADAPGRFGDRALAVDDPDGLRVELVESETRAAEPWPLGLHAVTLTVANAAPTTNTLEGLFGLRSVSGDETLRRLRGTADAGACVDVLQAPRAAQGILAAGAIHHVAFRATDDAHQAELLAAVRAAGVSASDVLDRKYFRSFYFREGGGVLFEVATDSPGFAVDEPAEKLGESLCLPPWLEGERAAIEGALPPLRGAVRAM